MSLSASFSLSSSFVVMLLLGKVTLFAFEELDSELSLADDFSSFLALDLSLFLELAELTLLIW